jgi:hypothetical protein
MRRGGIVPFHAPPGSRLESIGMYVCIFSLSPLALLLTKRNQTTLAAAPTPLSQTPIVIQPARI